MLIIRDVFQVKWGHVDEAVALMKEIRDKWNSEGKKGFAVRILTDASGPFFTMVTESEAQNLADWERLNAAAFADPDFAAWFARTAELVESGRREFYHLEG
ncbi:MAG: hypothetical protein DLM69_02330 [Candidatus Chloroheliales bacterium]|nr:MAG: hypothetical protein DLM69_02330 [Chloroflexota bacterium]